MDALAEHRATYEDILALPEHVIGELIAGKLYTQPRPAGPHTIVSTGLSAAIVGLFGRQRHGLGGWIIMHEPELHLGGDVLVPDIAGWRIERLPVEARARPYFTIVPDWICEVLSPSTARRDRQVKARTYAANHVAHFWLVDPVAGHVDAFARSSAGWTWLGSWSDDDAKIPPFEAAGLALSELWELVTGPSAE